MQSALIATLPHRGLVAVTGADRLNFLQGMVSQDVTLAVGGKMIYASLLSPQGKFLHDLFIFESGDAYWLDCEAARLDDLIHRLSRMKLRSDVAFADISADFGVAAAFNPENNSPLPAPASGVRVFSDPRLPSLGQRLIAPKAQLPGYDDQAARAYDRLRLSLGVPDGSRDMIPGESILLECNLEQLNAISFTKGCYVGQELTARTWHRALIKKRLFPVRIIGTAPQSGAVIMAGDQEAGVMRSSQGDLGLALLKITFVQNHGALACDGASLLPEMPGWLSLDSKAS